MIQPVRISPRRARDPDEAERRDQAIAFVKSLPGVTEVNASELVDAWHNDL